MWHNLSLQIEADLLKNAPIGTAMTIVIALGIGSGIDRAELNNMTSAPQSRNVILASNFNSLTPVEDRLTTASCAGE